MSSDIVKPWGKETILTSPQLPYTGKLLQINAGCRLSLQYHDQKIETLVLLSGSANLIQGNTADSLQTSPMVPSTGYTIQPNVIHRIEAVTDCLILEVSTPETGTTYRIEDDYQRQDETQSIRDLPNRGWTNDQ